MVTKVSYLWAFKPTLAFWLVAVPILRIQFSQESVHDAASRVAHDVGAGGSHTTNLRTVFVHFTFLVVTVLLGFTAIGRLAVGPAGGDQGNDGNKKGW